MRGSSILVTYVLFYAVIMTVGSHKQDRYLMPVFLSLDILGAMGLVYLWVWLRQGILASLQTRTLKIIEFTLLAGLVIIQAATVLPHHPYYYSYFNPLFGGGRTAVQTLRIGWGEGMDQVGAYLATKPDSQSLVVSSRFGHNMLGFKGKIDSLGPGGSWTRADYLVLYIQQVQRRLDPSPGFIDYFQARSPEKVITLGGIDYAWIYPIPFTTPADPQVSRVPGHAALLGYSWEFSRETGQPVLRLLWKNLGLADDRQLVARLVGPTGETDWARCSPAQKFESQAVTPGAYVESLCELTAASLPAGLYSVEFGLASLSGTGQITPFIFPEGWQAARIDPPGEVTDTPELERFQAIAAEHLPADARQLDRIYDGRIRLVAYRLSPNEPAPGDDLELTLYWQAVAVLEEPATLTVQLADSRSISLGRTDTTFPPPDQDNWLPGEVISTSHEFRLAPDLDVPLAGRVEVSLSNQAQIPLPPTNLAGDRLDPVIGHFTIAPDAWPSPDTAISVEAIWQSIDGLDRITLLGYNASPIQPRAGETLAVSLFWQADQPVGENYVVFVHLLDDAGQIIAQHDSLPRAGAYPTRWWLPGQVIEDVHQLTLPEAMSNGTYQLLLGLYQQENGVRLPLLDGDDSLVIGAVQIH